MLLTILVVLTVYLLACYGYGTTLLVRRGLQLRKQRLSTAPAGAELDVSVVTHRYPTRRDAARPMRTKAAA
jgi:hypothetical protein